MADKSWLTQHKMLVLLALLVVLAVLVVVVVVPGGSRQLVNEKGVIVTEGLLKQVYQQAQAQRKLIYLEFYAEWCGACKLFEERVLQLGDVRGALEKVVFVKIDVDQHGDIARAFGVEVVPTGVLAMARDEVLSLVDAHRGGLGAQELIDFVSRPLPTVEGGDDAQRSE